MFDLGWTELLVVAVVAILVVGPRDLPKMLRTFGNFVAQIRKMAREFQGQFDDALKEAELDDVKNSIAQVQKLNPATAVKDGINEALNPVKKTVSEVNQDLGDTYNHEWVKSLDDDNAAPAKAADVEAKTAAKPKRTAKSKATTAKASRTKSAPAKSSAAKSAAAKSTAGKSTAAKAKSTKPAAASKTRATAKAATPAASKASSGSTATKSTRSASKPAAAKPAAKAKSGQTATRKSRASAKTSSEASS